MIHIVRDILTNLMNYIFVVEVCYCDSLPIDGDKIAAMKVQIHKARMEANLAHLCAMGAGDNGHRLEDSRIAASLFAEADRLERYLMVCRHAS